MKHQERLAKAKKLELNNQPLLSTPLMSEGSISPMQVGLFSTRAKARWQSDAMDKMSLEYTIKQLRRTDEQLAYDEQRKQDKLEQERLSTISILERKIGFIDTLGTMSHKKNGQLKPLYQRTVEGYKQAISELSH